MIHRLRVLSADRSKSHIGEQCLLTHPLSIPVMYYLPIHNEMTLMVTQDGCLTFYYWSIFNQDSNIDTVLTW